MGYSAVQVHTLEGQFLGFSIRKEGAEKLHTENLWADTQTEELRAQLQRLNDDQNIRAFWPDVRDPEVTALLNDPAWMPLKMSIVQVVDEQASNFVWNKPPTDEDPFGEMNEDTSDIVYKLAEAPAPSDVQLRVKTACETVARRRANA